MIFTKELKDKVMLYAKEMHDYMKKGYTPNAKRSKSCNACSLKEICLPKLDHFSSVSSYINEKLAGDSE